MTLLLAFLGLSHWLLVAVLDLFGFPTNFYDRHYFFFLFVFFLMARPTALSVAVAGITRLGNDFFNQPCPTAPPVDRNLLIGSPVFGLKPVSENSPIERFLLEGLAFEAFLTCRRGAGIYSSCELGGNRSGTYDCERCHKPNAYALI